VFICILPFLLSAVPASRFDAEIAAAVRDVEHVHPVPSALIKAVIQHESGFNPKAISRAGAIGLMQVMPYSAPRVGVTEADLWDPAKNILAGARLLAVLLRYYRGDLISALVGYNARPRALFSPIPLNGETPGYVAAVLRFFDEYSTRPSGATGARHKSAGFSRLKPDWLLVGVPP
jgi:soluble lytic murein transglycosylase-like protein